MKSRRSLRRTSGRIQRSSSTALGSLALAAGALFGAFSSQAGAATQTLNTSGNWDTTSSVWTPGGVWVNGNDAQFGGTATAVEIAGGITVSGLSSANNIVFNNAIAGVGDSLTLVSSGGTPVISGGRNFTFNIGLGGTAGLEINNAGGIVTLNGDNALSGALTVTNGSLVLGTNGAINSVTAVNIASTGALTTGGVNQIAQTTVTNAGVLALGGNDTIAALVNSGTINGPGILRATTYDLNNGSVVNAQLGNGVITSNGLVAINGATGTTGSLNVQSGVTTASAALGATVVNVASGAALTTTATGSIADTAAVTLAGTGTVNLGQSETIGNLAGAGNVALGANTLTLSNGANATSSAAIAGTGGVTLSNGTQTLSGVNTYTGATNVNGGTLVVTGSLAGTTVNVANGATISSNGALADGTNLNLATTGAATFTGNETLASLTGGTGAINASNVNLAVTGAVNTGGNITVKDFTVGTLNGTSNIASTGVVTVSSGNFGGVITSGSLVKDSLAVLTLTGPQTYVGGTTVNAGTLVLGHVSNTLADSGALTVNAGAAVDLGANTDTVASFTSNGGTLSGTGTLTAATYALNNNSTVNANLGNGALTANGVVAINGNTGAGSVSIESGTTTLAGASAAATVNVASGATLATTSTGSIADTAAVTLTGTGALTLGHGETIGHLSGAGSVNLGASTLTLSNGANAASAAVINGTGGLTLSSGTQILSGASTYTGATNVNGGTLALTGSLTGTEVNVGSGAALTSTGGLADGTALTLGNSATATFTGAETLASLAGGGALTVTNLTVGNLGGSATINSSGVVTASTGTFGGVIASGSLVKNDAGTLTLNGVNTYVGGTTVNAGTLALGHATNTLADTGALTVNAGAAVDLGANTDTVASFTSNGGTLSGTGTLTAATYALNNNSTVNANFGAGAITANGVVAINGNTGAGSLNVQSGATTLAGASAATTVGISNGATLTTTAADRLADTAAVVNSGELSIGGNETIGSLDNTGTISGAGVLTTAVYNLGSGSNITGNLGAGVVNVNGNTGISGTAAAATVNVNNGTLTLAGNNLLDTALVVNGATLTLAGDDTVGTLNNTGTVSGPGVLTAATYNLGAGSVIAGNLGAGILNVNGDTTLTGTAAAGTVNIASGVNLTISGNNLADTASLFLDGTITVNGNDTIGTLVNNGGTIAGFGTLTASTYALNDGTVLQANLGAGNVVTNGAVLIQGLTGAGALTVESGVTTLDATSLTNTVNVNGGALVLTGDAEINVATTVNIANAASLTTGGVNQIGNATLTNAGTLTLGGNDIIAAYVANGGVLDGAGVTLTAATYALNDNAIVNANLGDGDLVANGTVAINGTVGAGTFTVQSGETTLANTSAADTVNITGGVLTLAGSNLLADTATVTNAGTLDLDANNETVAVFNSSGVLSGAGTLTAATYNLNGGSIIDANLGAGTLNANGTVAINGDTAAGSFNVQSGATTLAGASSAAAVTVFNGASLATTDTGTLNDNAIVALLGTGSLALGQSETIGNIEGAGSISLGEHTLTLSAGDQDSAAVISGTGGLTLTAGTQTLSGASTYTGATNVNGGTLALTGSLAGTEVNVASGATLTSTGGLADATDLTLDGTATFTGAETLASLDGAGSLTATDLTVGVLNGASTINSSGIVTVSSGDFDGVIATGALVKDTTSTLTLAATQTYTGGTTVNGGTLVLGHATDTLANTGALTINSGATVDLGANTDTVATLTSNGGTLAGTGTLTAATYSLNNGTTVDANLGNGTINANGTVAINGDTGTGSLNVLTGATTLAGASSSQVVSVANGAALTTTATGSLSDSALVAIFGTGSLTLGQSETVGNIEGAGTIALGEHTLTLSAGDQDSAAVISGTGGLTLTAGTQTLSGASTYTGATNVDGGELILTGTNVSTTIAVASGGIFTTGSAERVADTVVVTNNGVINLGGSETLGALAGSGSVEIGAFNLSFAGNGDSIPGEFTSDFSGSINGSGTITKTGADIQVLSGASAYSGIAFVNAGVLRVTNALALGVTNNNGRTEVGAGGTLQLAGDITLAEVIRPTGVGAQATFTGNDSYLTSLGAINNLSGDNILTGQIGIDPGQPDIVIGANAGTLSIQGDIVNTAIPPAPRITFQAATGATISLVGSNDFLYLLNVGDVAKTGGGVLDITNIVGNQSFGNLLLQDGTVLTSEEIQLGGSEVRFGSTDRGTLRIAAASTQTAIAPAVGQSVTGGDGDFADFRNTVFDLTDGDGTIQTDADTVVTLANIVNFSDSRLIKSGAGDLLLDLGTVIETKAIPSLLVTQGNVFFLAADGADLSLGGLDGTGGNLELGGLDATINQNFDGTFAGNLTGTGNLTINATNSGSLVSTGVLADFASVTIGGDGTGSVALNGNSTYTGPTTVATGGNLILGGTLQTALVDVATGATLTLAASDRLLDTATLTNAGTVDLGANTESVATFTSNGGTLNGTGTLTAATYDLNAGTVINGNLGDGIVTVSGDVVINANTGVGTVTVTNGATLRGVGMRLGGDLVVDLGGTLAPGASPGVTTVAGNWTQNGTFQAELAGLGGPGAVNGHDQVVVGGTITLGPASTLAIQRFGAFTEPARGDTFRIIVGDLNTQQFANVTTQFSTGLVLDLADGTLIGTGLASSAPNGHVDLTTLPGLDGNTIAIVGAVQDIAYVDGPGGVQFNSTLGANQAAGAAIRALLTTGLGAGNGINILSPESFAAETGYAVRATRHYADVARNTAPVLQAGDFSLFTAYSSHRFGTDSSVNSADYDLDGSGGLVGGRYSFKRVSVGAFAAFDSGEIKSTYRKADIDGTIYGVFAEVALPKGFSVNASAFTGSYDSDSTRDSLFAGTSNRADGIGSTANGFSLGVSLDVVKTASAGLSPYVEFNYVKSSSDAFTETGSPDSLSVDSIDYTSLRGELGARGYVAVSNRFSFTGQLGVSQEFGDDDTEVTGRIAGSAGSMRVVSPGPGDTVVSAGVGVRFDATRHVFLSAGVNAALVSDADTATSFHVGGGVKF